MNEPVCINDLKPDAENARRHNPRNIDMITSSLGEVGAARSIVIDEDNVILAGNGVLQAAKAAGIENVRVVEADGQTIIAVRRSGLTAEQKKKLAYFDNRTAELADWSPEQVLADLDAGFDLSGLWDKNEIDELLVEIRAGDAPEDPGAQIDKAAELQEKWKVERGQVWQCGQHRLMCGDSTVAGNVKRLMERKRANAVVTDPPYGYNREGIINDDPLVLRELFDGVLMVMPIDNSVIVAFQSPRLFPIWLNAIQAAGHKFERMLWMYKPNDETYPWRGWLQKSEAILISSLGKPQWVDTKPYTHDCYYITTLGKELPKEWGKAHASVKPLTVIQDLINRIGGNVFDPFLGSGTTLVACEQTGRIGYGMEIEPKYCAVTLERLAGLGLKPQLIND